MAAALASPFRRAVSSTSASSCRQVVVNLSTSNETSPYLRLAATGAIAYCTVFPLVQVALIAETYSHSLGHAGWALGATALYLPLHLRHVLYAIRGSGPPPAAHWTLAAMAAVIVGALPLAGFFWLPTFHVIAVSALIVLRPRWSIPVVALLAVAQVPLANAVHSGIPAAPSYFVTTLLWRTVTVFVPIWLARSVQQLDAARRALADDAVLRERLRVDADLRRTVGVELGAIVAKAQQASNLAATEPDASKHELTMLVASTRRTLATARKMISGLHRASLWAELETAATLLTAAGIQTVVVLPEGDPPDLVEETFRRRLRSATADLLRDESARTCVIAVTRSEDQLWLEMRVDDHRVASIAVTAS